MLDQIRVTLRMRDVAMALGAASEYRQQLSRIQLQKFVYLLDVISPLYSFLPPREGHLTYKHGPYDAAIQNAVDALAFRGLVKIQSVHKSSEGTIAAVYALEPEGLSWLQNLSQGANFDVLWKVARNIASKVERFGWHRLVNLVYAEPTFVGTRPIGYGQKLVPYDGLANSAAQLIFLMDHTLRAGFEKPRIEQTLIVELFFRFLDAYDRQQQMIRVSVEP